MTDALNGLPPIVRTLDIGGDKHVPYLNQPAEENPFLGIRGIRLCLERTDLFETQLRAILRAARGGYLRVMFPMIATLEDIRAAKAVLESVWASIDRPPVEIGMMVEVPSAVLMAAEFAQEVDFFSVGTNDLTQYLLAMDRGHSTLAKQADALHPAVLRAIYQTVQGAKLAGKWIGVCVGLAGTPQGAMILAGLGVKELSMDIPSIPQTPPFGLALATVVSKKYFNQAEQEAGKVASVLGISFITEGAIPFAANDPLRILPACIAGSAVAGALSMAFGCTLRAPHGGVFVLAIPNAVENVGLYIVAIAAGTLVTALVTVQLKHWFPRKRAIAEG